MAQSMEEAVARSQELHAAGYNCAQCVACACADRAGLDEDLAFRLMEGFGGGMGDFSQTCGAISGGVAVLGLLNSGGPEAQPRTKGSTYKLAKQVVRRFGEMNGSTLCGDLKGLTGGEVLRSCDGCIEDATRITLDVIAQRENA